MNINFRTYIKSLLVMATAITVFASCNKDVPDAVPVTPATPTATKTVYEILSDPNYSILKAAVDKAGLTATLSDQTAVYTLFAPTDASFQAAFQLLGIPAAVGLNALRPGQLDTILRYHIVGGQKVTTDSIALRSPNLQLPSLFQLAPPSASLPPGLRLSVFASKNVNVFWLNNIPLQGPGADATNGIVYPLGFVALPPSSLLWTRISSDPNLTYLKAAIQRADEASPSPNLVAALGNAAANLTVFAPTDAAMKKFLIGSISKALMAKGLPEVAAQFAATALVTTYGTTIISAPASIPDAPIFPTGTGIGPALAAVLTPTQIAGLAAYHLLIQRSFTVNLPITETAVATALAANLPTATVNVKAVFGTGGVTAATVQGKADTSASNVLINPLPGAGTSDQHYINGVLHEIDQVLVPQ